jgi:precorrin-8X/cobalt-precorrin-8 methylmutase
LAATGSSLAAWETMWFHLAAAVTDDDRNRNNRWAVAAALNQRLGANHFWGVPAARATEWLPTRKPADAGLPALRGSEVHLLEQTRRRPFSVWQLLGAGAVGSQTLMGIPALQRIRTAEGLAERTHVWPFETGFTTDPCRGRSDAIVLAEVWPSAIDVDHVEHPVKDARQVVALAQHFAAAEAAGELGSWFRPSLSPAEEAAALAEEGWVLHG